MTQSYFSVADSAQLADVPAGGSIHVIGVCGVAMAQIAEALAERGYAVTGSDKEYYEPMKSLLERSRVRTLAGFDASHVPSSVALAVIGNSISYGNPEVSAVEEGNIPYSFFPKLLAETVIGDRHSIAVCGTHGKTTTTALVATVLCAARRSPSYFIGGAAKGFEKSLVIGSGSVSVVEGDEYDSAFFAKVPKFFFYKPKTAIITSIEYDHADIYPSLESIIEVFGHMVSSVPEDGRVICCADCPNVRRLAAEWKRSARSSIVTYGEHESADVRITGRRFEDSMQRIRVKQNGIESEISCPVMGLHNARNAVAAYLAAIHAGLSPDEASAGLQTFRGVRRRQDLRAEKNGISIIEDFAHHPTAVQETLAAIRERYDGRRIIAVFEPRSNTSRRKVFQEAYVRSFSSADSVILCAVSGRQSDQGHELMDVGTLAQDIAAAGKPCRMLPDAGAIFEAIERGAESGDVVVVMSNGSFGGLMQRLETRFG